MKKIYNIELDYDQLDLLLDILGNAENIAGENGMPADDITALAVDIERQAREQES